MKRRAFVATTMTGALGLSSGAAAMSALPSRQIPEGAQHRPDRDEFPRLEHEVYVNGAGGTPLGRFAETGVDRYLDMARLGRGDGRGQWWGEVWDGVRGRFATLIGADPEEIGLVECTKAGEQIVLDGLDGLRNGGNIVTNDLHFSGSLHNLEGLRRAGRDVRIVPSADFAVSLDRMADAIDEQTALVTVSLVSNITGHVEAMAELSRLAHDRGAIVFADIIQGAGIVPIDVREMGIDVAACSSYKWLYGLHGAGFLYVRRDLQGALIRDSLFPGHVSRAYEPFAAPGSESSSALTYSAPVDARRYQPGHVNYLGYAAVHEGLGFIARHGVGALQRHSVALNRRLIDQLDQDRFEVLSSHVDESPILALAARDFDATLQRLIESDVVISAGGDKWNLLRISPAIYNTEADMDRVAEVLAG